MSPAAAACLIAASLAAAPAGEVFDEPTLRFARQLDVEALSLLGVQYAGRTAILDTLAREQLDQMYGSERIDAQGPAFAYLELYLNAGRYVDKPLLYIREKNMRAFLAEHLDAAAAKAFQRTRRIPPATLLDDEAWQILLHARRADAADRDRARGVASLRDALPELSQRKELRVAIDRLSVRYSGFLAMEVLRVVPQARGPWLTSEEAFAAAAARTQPAADPIAAQWAALRDAWRARHAAEVNRLIRRIDAALAARAGQAYPSLGVRRLERLYNRMNQFTVVWIGYAAALALLIVAAASSRLWARAAGLGVFGLSTAMLLIGFIVRWLVSGRSWYLPPIMNQFEAVVGSALLGSLIALALELAWRRNYFALAASLYAAVSLLSGLIFPEQMSPDIRAQHGILASPVMAAHVALIIIGHALVGMTFFISYAYLVVTAARGAPRQWSTLVAVQVLGWAMVLTLLYVAVFRIPPGQAVLLQGALSGALAAFVLLVAALALLAGIGAARLGGAVSAAAALRASAAGDASAAIDRCNLIVAQLACWTVVVGTILGAYWADFAWGRWWGWDPKETWALITCLLYVALLHVRFVTPIRWRGLVTALICILGCLAMLFNWIAVNFLLAGKHSYA